MHRLLRCARPLRCYSTATPFVPPASLDPRSTPPPRTKQQKPRPTSPSFYTARAAYYDQLTALESASQHASHALRALHLLPLPPFARAALPPPEFAWKNKADLEAYMQCTLTMSRYRRVLALLAQLNEYRRIADTAGCAELAAAVAGILDIFRKGAQGRDTSRKSVVLDVFGRSYTVGRRKTSAARVWIIPTREPQPEPNVTDDLPSLLSPTPTTILINNLPLSTYFPLPSDREKVVRPLKLAGVLGAYNIFALVRGGGTTGQSGSVALAVAKGLAVHEPRMEDVLRRAKLLRRDPRMVERKKTGLAKARKRYAWVRR